MIIKNNDYNNNDNNNKYRDLEIEIKKTLKLQSTTVPVVISAFRYVKKGTEHYLYQDPRKQSFTRFSSLGLLTYSGGHYPASNPRDLWLP